MKKILFLILILSLTTLLQAYSKKIIFVSFSSEKRALNSLNLFKKSSNYKKLDKLAKENDFKIYTRASGKYYIVVAEPLLLRSVGVQAYKLIKKSYKHAYPAPYVPLVVEEKIVVKEKIKEKPKPKKEVVKVVQKQKMPTIPKDINKTKEVVKPVIKEIDKEEAKEKSVAQREIIIDEMINKGDKLEDLNLELKEFVLKIVTNIMDNFNNISLDFNLDNWSILKYLSIFFVLLILLYYYIKFKRIYDEY